MVFRKVRTGVTPRLNYFSPTCRPVRELVQDLTDESTIHSPLHLVIQVGEAIEVSTERQRGAKEDPLTEVVRAQIGEMIADINANPPQR